jgi:hypothetical protein
MFTPEMLEPLAPEVPRMKRSQLAVESLEGKLMLSDLAVSLTTDAHQYMAGQVVHMTFVEKNVSNHTVSVSYGPSNDGFYITHGSATVWRSNTGPQPQYILLRMLKPGDSIVLEATYKLTSTLGAFVVHNQLAPNGPTASFNVVR